MLICDSPWRPALCKPLLPDESLLRTRLPLQAGSAAARVIKGTRPRMLYFMRNPDAFYGVTEIAGLHFCGSLLHSIGLGFNDCSVHLSCLDIQRCRAGASIVSAGVVSTGGPSGP